MQYKVGMKIRISYLDDPYAHYEGRVGEIQRIDDAGQLHGTWGGLAVIPGVDACHILSEEEYQAYMQRAREKQS